MKNNAPSLANNSCPTVRDHCRSIVSHGTSAGNFERYELTLCRIRSGLLGLAFGGVEKVSKTLTRNVWGHEAFANLRIDEAL